MCIFERLLIFLNILYDTKPVISIDEKSTIFYPVKQRGAKFDNKRIVLIVLHSKFPVSMYKFQSKYTDVTYLRIAGIIPDPLFSLPRKPESFANGSYMVQCISSYLSARRNWRVYTRTHTHTCVRALQIKALIGHFVRWDARGNSISSATRKGYTTFAVLQPKIKPMQEHRLIKAWHEPDYLFVIPLDRR